MNCFYDQSSNPLSLPGFIIMTTANIMTNNKRDNNTNTPSHKKNKIIMHTNVITKTTKCLRFVLKSHELTIDIRFQ